MATKLWAIGIVFLCTFLTSVAQVFYKWAALDLSFNPIALITNIPLIIGLSLYAVGAVLLIIGLKGGELTVLYPVVATSYIWVSLMSTKFLPVTESMNFMKWGGVFVIFAGISLIGFGSMKTDAETKVIAP